ncbi:MAG: hypothetical protein ACLFVC_04200 [Opitutales bacterium]
MRRPLRILALGLLSITGVHGQGDGPLLPGLAFLTTVDGEVRHQPEGRSARSPEIHAAISLNQSTLSTGPEAFCGLALSNGIALGLDANSTLRIPGFRQARFPEEKASLTYEPSMSELTLQLESGTLAVACDHLSPLSEMWIHLPLGKIRVHSATCVVAITETGVQLTVYQGHLTYYYPDASKREFISSEQSLRISPTSARMGRVAETAAMDGLPAEWRQLSEATYHASKRVFFLPGDPESEAPATPVPIVPPDYYDQESARPYQLSD